MHCEKVAHVIYHYNEKIGLLEKIFIALILQIFSHSCFDLKHHSCTCLICTDHMITTSMYWLQLFSITLIIPDLKMAVGIYGDYFN